MGGTVTRSWWRRNTAALIALAVLLPASAWAIGWREWSSMYDNGATRSRPVLPDEEGVVDLVGTFWGPARSASLDASEDPSIPAGTQVVAVKVPVDNREGSEPAGCPAPVLVEQSTGRQWSEMSLELGAYDLESPVSCDSERYDAYELFVPFIIPADAEGPFWIDISPFDGGSEFVRLPVAP